MAGMVLLMEILAFWWLLVHCKITRRQRTKGHFSLKDDDKTFKYNTLIILLPCSYFEIPYIWNNDTDYETAAFVLILYLITTPLFAQKKLQYGTLAKVLV
jgi:hypothetical protein